MTEPTTRLADLAAEVRSKNAGPFWVTLEAFMRDDAGYSVADHLITADLIAHLYRVDVSHVQIFRIPELHVVKVSFPRAVGHAGLHDRDIHSGQHHVPLGWMPVTGPEHSLVLRPH